MTVQPGPLPGPFRVRVELVAARSGRHPRVDDAGRADAGRHTTAPVATLSVAR